MGINALSPIEIKGGRKPYDTVTLTLAAAGSVGDRVEVHGTLRFLTLNTATDNTAIQVSWDGGQNFVAFPAGITVSGFAATSFWVKNTSVSANTVVFFKGEAEYVDNRILLSALSAVPVSAAASAFATGAIVDLGLKADSAATTDTGTFSLIALFKRLLSVNLTTNAGAAGDTAATTDTGTFSLIALIKRLLGKFDTLTNSVFTLNAANSTNLTAIKASAGRVKSIDMFNAVAAVAYVRFYDVAVGSVTVGTTVPFRTYAVPASGSLHVDFPGGDTYATAITIATVTGAARADATAVAAEQLQIAVNYQ